MLDRLTQQTSGKLQERKVLLCMQGILNEGEGSVQ
jgi:hypothetical protein